MHVSVRNCHLLLALEHGSKNHKSTSQPKRDAALTTGNLLNNGEGAVLLLYSYSYLVTTHQRSGSQRTSHHYLQILLHRGWWGVNGSTIISCSSHFQVGKDLAAN